MNNRPEPRHLFLIGSEASAALSPALWAPVLTQLDNGWTYRPLDVPAGTEMGPVRDLLLEPATIAANITMPHKHWAAQTADTASETVARSGAANLLIRRNGQLQAHNTDISAFTALLPKTTQPHVLVLGAGGAARASVASLPGLAKQITVLDQNPQAAQQLARQARQVGLSATAAGWHELDRHTRDASLIINATPIGKKPSDPPAWGNAQLSANTFIYDYVYAAHETATIQQAREKGLKYSDGWEHLLHQATAMIPLLNLDAKTRPLLETSLQTIRHRTSAPDLS